MPLRTCVDCGEDKPIDQFGRVKSRCISCNKIFKAESNRRWYEKNREREIKKRLDYAKRNRSDCSRRHGEYLERLKIECYNILDNICSCGEYDKDVFQIDHINGGGNQEHQELARHQFLLRVKECPEAYQILCANCNWRKRKSWLLRKESTTRLRNQAILKYGGCCSGCGEDDFEVLQFDHVNNDGANNFRRRVMEERYNSYIKRDHNIQLLCCNCHQRKSLKMLRI